MTALALPADLSGHAAAGARTGAFSLETVSMTKVFGSLVALDDVSIKVGEHALHDGAVFRRRPGYVGVGLREPTRQVAVLRGEESVQRFNGSFHVPLAGLIRETTVAVLCPRLSVPRFAASRRTGRSTARRKRS